LSLGVYRVRVLSPQGSRQTTVDPPNVVVSKGQLLDRVDFGLNTPKVAARSTALQDAAIVSLTNSR
jgi:hypothetical protein